MTVTSNTDEEIKSRFSVWSSVRNAPARETGLRVTGTRRGGTLRGATGSTRRRSSEIERSVARNMRAARAGDRPADSLR